MWVVGGAPRAGRRSDAARAHPHPHAATPPTHSPPDGLVLEHDVRGGDEVARVLEALLARYEFEHDPIAR